MTCKICGGGYLAGINNYIPCECYPSGLDVAIANAKKAKKAIK